MCEFAQLQVNDDEGAKMPMEEEEINPIPFVAHPKPLLARHKSKIVAQLEQEMFEMKDQRLFQLSFRILILETQKTPVQTDL